MKAKKTSLLFLAFALLLFLIGCEREEPIDPADYDTSPDKAAVPEATASAENAADFIFANGIIYGNPTADAVATTGNNISFIGSTADAEPLMGDETIWVDLEGALLLPGFIDFHNHFAEDGGTTCFPETDFSLDEQRSLLTSCRRGVARGEWVIGYGSQLAIVLDGSDDPNWLNPRQVLDDVFPDHPVIIMEQTSHAMFANSLALDAAAITASTPDPAGGKIMKDEFGQPNGILVDNAGDVVMELATNSAPNAFDINYDGLIYGMNEVKENGITTVGDGRTYWRRGMMDVWFDAEEQGLLTVRVSVRPWIYPDLAQGEQLDALAAFYQGDINRQIIVNQVKMYIDGVPENGTARVIEPYTYTLFQESPNGINYISEAEMIDWLGELWTLGYGAHVHSLGDLGIRETLNAFEVLRQDGSDQAFSITHAFMLDPADAPRFAALDVDVDIQVGEEVLMTQEERAEFYTPFIGQQRASELYFTPVRVLNEAGANVILSSDWTVYNLNPLIGISVAVSQGSFDTVEEAIDAYTIRPATALGLETITGSIEVGKSADFAILPDDITQLPPNQIMDVPVVMTVFQGDIVYPEQYANYAPILFAPE